ncbi:hypothetical protein HGRIS_004676 [Hohenbuehelia grisea]|uniref:HD/PDEase domain-containing protein n=1 Tax=Hohenbuehelia grisea TaxID=104357 RepID=A0ABR3JDE0_9AGAR
MYPSPQERVIINAAEKLMIDTMARYDPSHDHFHVQRVRKTAIAIAREVAATTDAKPDLLTVELATLLHDVLDKKYVSHTVAADPYAYFLPFFTSTRPGPHPEHLETEGSDSTIDLIADGRARTIARIVDNVSWSNEKRLRAAGMWDDWHRECVELHCVQDADRLDAIGAFGIMRCSAYNAVTGHALHTPAGDPGHADSAIQHFHDKLLHVAGQLKTEPGKRMGAKRHQALVAFLEAVDEEYEAAIPPS